MIRPWNMVGHSSRRPICKDAISPFFFALGSKKHSSTLLRKCYSLKCISTTQLASNSSSSSRANAFHSRHWKQWKGGSGTHQLVGPLMQTIQEIRIAVAVSVCYRCYVLRTVFYFLKRTPQLAASLSLFILLYTCTQSAYIDRTEWP